MRISFYEGVLLFLLFSVMGWICESIWCSVGERKLVNRGFLAGPYCPIYGFGGLLILLICLPVKAYPPLVFVMALLSASALEYFTGWLLEALFHTRWWDYSKRPLNIKGRVCLRNSVLFGLMGLAVTYVAYPPLGDVIADIPMEMQRSLALSILLLVGIDLVHTVTVITGLERRLIDLHNVRSKLRQYSDAYGWFDLHDLSGSTQRLREICAADEGNETAAEILRHLDAQTPLRPGTARLLGAFPTLRHKNLPEELEALRESRLRRAKNPEGFSPEEGDGDSA